MAKPTLSVIMPALNEEKNIIAAIDNTLMALKKFDIKGEIIIIDDGSQDNTLRLIEDRAKENPNFLHVLRHFQPKGIGASFWKGVREAKGEIVLMIPGDNENNPQEILRYYDLLNHVDIVVPFVFNKEVRSFARNFISSFYLKMINFIFRTNFHYTNGTVLYRKSSLENIKPKSSGFFFQTEALIKTVKKRGYLFAEVPVALSQRKGGASKAINISSISKVIKECLILICDYYFKSWPKNENQLAQNSVSALRKKYAK